MERWKSPLLQRSLYLTVNEVRSQNMPIYYDVATNSATTTTNLVYTSNATTLYSQWPSVQGEAYWYQPAQPAKAKIDRPPKPESDMAWLKRRVNEVCWVPT